MNADKLTKEIFYKISIRWVNYKGGTVIVTVRRNKQDSRQKVQFETPIELAEVAGDRMAKEILSDYV